MSLELQKSSDNLMSQLSQSVFDWYQSLSVDQPYMVTSIETCKPTKKTPNAKVTSLSNMYPEQGLTAFPKHYVPAILTISCS